MAEISRVDPDLRVPFGTLVSHDFADLDRAREVARARREAAIELVARKPLTVTISETEAHSGVARVSVRKISPVRGGDAALIWIHGGGHVMGAASQDDTFLSELVAAVGCTAFSVEVRLAPESPYPAALDDAAVCFDWLRASAETLGLRPDLIAIGGASAGGGVAAGLALRLRDAGIDQPCLQLLVYPMLDDRTDSSPAGFDLASTGAWSPISNRYAWSAYLRDVVGDIPPYAAPSRASTLTGLAPAVAFVGELDLFREEVLVYGGRLLRAGVPTELRVYRGAFHGFNTLAPSAPISQRFNRDVFDALGDSYQRARLEDSAAPAPLRPNEAS